MMMAMIAKLRFGAALLLVAIVMAAGPARATTGSGCYQVVNVPANDVLNVRAGASASSAIVYRIPAGGGPIISGGRSTADAQRRCVPAHLPLASRWCPVSLYTGDGSHKGWIKRRFLTPSDCP